MARERAEIEAALLKKGFRYKGGDHRFYFFEYHDRPTAIFTKVSHGSKYKTIDDRLLGKMAKQVKLTNKQFKKLIDCPMEKNDYINQLKLQGLIF